MSNCVSLNDCIAATNSDTLLKPQGNNASSLSGITDINGFGNPVPFATTFAQAVENVYSRVNYNANWDAYGNKLGWTIYPDEKYSRNDVTITLTEYSELAAGNKIPVLQSAIIQNEGALSAIVSQIYSNAKSKTKKELQSDAIRTIIKEFYWACESEPISIDRIFLNPKVATAPTAEDRAAMQRARDQKTIEAEKDEAERLKNSQTFFGKIGNSISDLLGTASNTGKIIAYGGSTVIVGGLGLIIWTFMKKTRELNSDKAFSQVQETNRTVAKEAGKAADIAKFL